MIQTTPRYGCDWWMPSRAKCPTVATRVGVDAYGAPWRYCERHWKIAHPGINFVHGPLSEQTP